MTIHSKKRWYCHVDKCQERMCLIIRTKINICICPSSIADRPPFVRLSATTLEWPCINMSFT